MAAGGRVELLGQAFDPVTMDRAVARVLAWCAPPSAPHLVVTVNASHLCMARRDEALRAACASGDLVVADGMSVVWASRLLGAPLPERIGGIDLMDRLLAEGGRRGLSAYFLGARPEVVARLAELAPRRWPGIRVAGARDGYFGPVGEAAVVEAVAAAAPDLLFVGMPSPAKERFLARHAARLGAPVQMGVGGSFDVLAGEIRRAPLAMQRLGLEWLWRLLQEPRKLFWRYLTTNLQFLGLVARERWRRREGPA